MIKTSSLMALIHRVPYHKITTQLLINTVTFKNLFPSLYSKFSMWTLASFLFAGFSTGCSQASADTAPHLQLLHTRTHGRARRERASWIALIVSSVIYGSRWEASILISAWSPWAGTGSIFPSQDHNTFFFQSKNLFLWGDGRGRMFVSLSP